MPVQFDSLYSSQPPFETGLKFVVDMGIFSPDFTNALPQKTQDMNQVTAEDPNKFLALPYIYHLGCLLTGVKANIIRRFLHKMPDANKIQLDIYIALESLQALILQRTGRLLHFRVALKYLRERIIRAGYIRNVHHPHLQNNVWVYWKLMFEGDAPLLDVNWMMIKPELDSLRAPERTQACETHDFSQYLKSFFAEHMIELSPNKRLAKLFDPHEPASGDVLQGLLHCFNKLSSILIYFGQLSQNEKSFVLKQCLGFLKSCETLRPELRLRAFLHEITCLQTYQWIATNSDAVHHMEEWSERQRGILSFISDFDQLSELREQCLFS